MPSEDEWVNKYYKQIKANIKDKQTIINLINKIYEDGYYDGENN